jgi:hypothetical protein
MAEAPCFCSPCFFIVSSLLQDAISKAKAMPTDGKDNNALVLYDCFAHIYPEAWVPQPAPRANVAAQAPAILAHGKEAGAGNKFPALGLCPTHLIT